MTTFFEANQARLQLKMKLVNHSWYKGISVVSSDDGFDVLIGVTHIDNSIRKVVPQVFNDVSVAMQIESK